MKRERYKRLIMFFASLLVIGLQTLNFAYVWFTEYNKRSVIQLFYWRRGNWVLFGMYASIIFLMSKLFGALKVGYMRVQDVIISQICAVIATNIISYVQLALIGRWMFPAHLSPMVRLTAFNLIIVILWVVFMRWIYNTIYPPKSVILIYDEHNPEKLLRNIASRRDKYVISEAVLLDRGIEYIQERILNYQACILGDMPSHDRNRFVKYCFENNIRCYCSPKISDIMLMSSEKIHMFDTPLLLMRNRGLTVEQQFIKRALDIIISVFLLIMLFPLLVIIALIIWIYDRGPVFYTQERLTQDGRVFKIVKFRSMKVDSEIRTGARLASEKDSRVTPVGLILRKIHFDELPQLFNIIKGDMSIVGPRPERPEIAALYEREIPEFCYRLKVKAGLTGYAQVYGKYNTKPYDKLKLDLTYIENYSLLLDIQLIAATVKVLFQPDNTEGVESSQKTASLGEENIAPDKRKLEREVTAAVERLKKGPENDKFKKGPENDKFKKGPENDKFKNGPENDRLRKGSENARFHTYISAEMMKNAKDTAVGHEPGMLVSVIIPVRNGQEFLADAIDSVLSQNMHFESTQKIGRGSVQEMEVIVVDDASTDDIISVMERYENDDRVIFLHNDAPLGAAASRNRGVFMARGKYVAFLDADDMWSVDKLKKQFKCIYQTGDVICCTGRELMKSDGTLTGRIIGVKRRISYNDLLLHNQINCSSVVMPTEVAREFPMEHEDSHEDYITWMNVLKKYGEAAGVNEPLLKYRMSVRGKSGSKLKSAVMTYTAYRYVGFSRPKSILLFVSYAFHGFIKYARA